ncbi:MAG: pentapeptide repeat-containing protein [Gloeobacterales cyanobacterium]
MPERSHSLTTNLQRISTHFLEQNPKDRLLVLRSLGLARYATFLAQMPLTESNVACVMRFFQNPDRVKFPDLRAVELADLVLDGVNFIRGDLSGADLRGCRLHKADLVFARLVQTDLRDADLRGATLNETLWFGTLVKGCQLGRGIGLTEQQRRQLNADGALFEHSF